MSQSILRQRNSSFSLIAAAVSAALSSAVAHGTQAPTSDTTLATITVTATRRTENIETVPLSVTALSGTALKQQGITNIMSLDQGVPGLTLENSGDNPTPIIRGAGAAGTTDVAVPFYVDGVYQPNSGQGLVSFVDLKRVEVLKGPQGTLFGRNTLGGLINLISNKPALRRFDAGAAVTYGDYNDRKIDGFVNVPIGNTVAARVAAAAEKRNPFVRNIANPGGGLKDADYSYVRAQLLWQPVSSLRVDFTGTYWHDTSNGNNDFGYKVLGIPVNPATHQVDGVNGFLDPRQGLRTGWGGGKPQDGNISNGDPAAMIYLDPYTISWDYKPHRNILEKSGTLNIKWDFLGNQLVANLSEFDYSELRLTDGDLSVNPALVAGQSTKTTSYQVDVHLNSTRPGRFQYTVGAYLFDDSTWGNNSSGFLFGYTYTSPQRPTWASWLYSDDGGTRSTALYGQADYSLTKKLKATAGVRWTHDERNSYQLDVIQSTLTDTLPSYGGSPVNHQSGSSSHTDFRVGLEYELMPHTMLYAYEATGYIAGATQALTNKLLPPNTVRTFEAGAKTTTLDDHLIFNVAVYTAEYNGLTTTIFVPVGNTILAQQIPGGSMRSSGVEMDTDWIPIQRMHVELGIAADRSTFDHFIAADRLGTDGASFIDSSGKGWFVLNNQPTAFSPDLTANLGLTYDFSLGSTGHLIPAVFTKYSSRYKTTNEPYFWSIQPAYAIINASLTWRAPDGLWSVKAFVDNATDKAVMTEGTVYSGSRAVADFNNPRFWGIRIGYNF